jgi:hypothetical protein
MTTTKTATIMHPDGTTTELEPADGDQFTLEQLQEAVGGYVEQLSFADGELLLFNEDGRMKQLPPNRLATLWLLERGRALGRSVDGVPLQLVGPAVACHSRADGAIVP